MWIVNKIFFGASKKALLLTASLVWGFAAYKVLETGFMDVLYHAHFYWLNILIGVIGAYFFFTHVFFKIYLKHVKRVLNLQSEKHSIFSFFDLKSYMIMAFMITTGIFIKYTHLIPSPYLGTFYITLGGALLSAALSFMSSFIEYNYVSQK